MRKVIAIAIAGTVTRTSKMPCKSYSLPTIACKTGFKLAKIPGTICHDCYANKGFYRMYEQTVEPAQHARLDSLTDPDWPVAMAALIGLDEYFRWHDSGDLQSVDHLRAIVRVCEMTPNCRHWLPTREPGMVSQFLRSGGTIPENLTIRISATYPDVAVRLSPVLAGVAGIETSNVHSKALPGGFPCGAYKNAGKCGACRACFHRSGPVSYPLH